MKYKMVQRRWKELYDVEAAKELQEAVMNHMYKNRFGEEAMDESDLLMDEYNPLHLN